MSRLRHRKRSAWIRPRRNTPSPGMLDELEGVRQLFHVIFEPRPPNRRRADVHPIRDQVGVRLIDLHDDFVLVRQPLFRHARLRHDPVER